MVSMLLQLTLRLCGDCPPAALRAIVLQGAGDLSRVCPRPASPRLAPPRPAPPRPAPPPPLPTPAHTHRQKTLMHGLWAWARLSKGLFTFPAPDQARRQKTSPGTTRHVCNSHYASAAIALPPPCGPWSCRALGRLPGRPVVVQGVGEPSRVCPRPASPRPASPRAAPPRPAPPRAPPPPPRPPTPTGKNINAWSLGLGASLKGLFIFPAPDQACRRKT